MKETNQKLTQLNMIRIILLILLLIPSSAVLADSSAFSWKQLPSLPPPQGLNHQAGLAAPFAGIHQNVLLVAGGSNFSATALADGGEKQYHNDVYVLHNTPNSPIWEVSATKFPYPVAHGISITTPDGIVCIGGKNGDNHLNKVNLMYWNPKLKTVEFRELPDLPYTNADMAGAMIGNKVYVVAGAVDGVAANNALCLDMSDTKAGWHKIPELPGSARLMPVMAAQNAGEENCLFLFGGYNFDTAQDKEPQMMTDGYQYIPSQEKWVSLPDIRVGDSTRILVGSSAISMGTGHILFSGGVAKEIFFYDQDIVRQIRNAGEQGNNELLSRLTADRLAYWLQDPSAFRFNPDLLAYHTITGTWMSAAQLPWQPTAGAAMIHTDDGFILVNGEVKPGVRTNEVHEAQISNTTSFGIVNYAVLFVYLIGMLLVGFYFMKRSSGDTDDFFQGGQRIPWWAAGISIFATALSAITFLSIPAKAYATDWRMLIFNIAIILVVPIVVKYYLPFFRKLNMATAYEYLEGRFNRPVRFFASALFCIFMVTRIAIVLFLPSLALNAVTGINVYFCILVMGLITIAYCTMGGVEAVIWGDVIQGLVLVLGAVISLVYMIVGTDQGLSGFITTASEVGKFHTFDFSFDWTQPVFWVAILGGLANQLITYTSDQSVIQRYMTTKDEKSASRSIWLNGIISIPVSVIFFLLGTALYTFYKSNPEHLNISMQNPDAIFPHFMVSELPMGLAGLLIAAVFSAAMSTLSSNINSVSAAITEDFFQQLKQNLTEKSRMRIARISGLLVGLIGTGFALGLATWDIKSLWDQFNVFLGLLTSGLGGLFLMGIFTKRINSTSAMIGLLSSIVMLLLIRSYTNISFLLFGFIGLVTSFVIGWLCSWVITNNNKKPMDI